MTTIRSLKELARPIIEEMLDLLDRKNRDYGSDNLLITGVRGIAVRLTDKVERIRTLTGEEREGQNNESIEDTFTDTANYGILGKMMQRGILTSKQKLVYLAGPIDVAHIPDYQAPDPIGWRIQITADLGNVGHAVYNPYSAFDGAEFPLAKQVTSINRTAILSSDVVLANLQDGITIGTVREIEFARANGIRVVAVINEDYAPFGIHDLECVYTFEDAIKHV